MVTAVNLVIDMDVTTVHQDATYTEVAQLIIPEFYRGLVEFREE